jgi:hypothetical protein
MVSVIAESVLSVLLYFGGHNISVFPLIPVDFPSRVLVQHIEHEGADNIIATTVYGLHYSARSAISSIHSHTTYTHSLTHSLIS